MKSLVEKKTVLFSCSSPTRQEVSYCHKARSKQSLSKLMIEQRSERASPSGDAARSCAQNGEKKTQQTSGERIKRRHGEEITKAFNSSCAPRRLLGGTRN